LLGKRQVEGEDGWFYGSNILGASSQLGSGWDQPPFRSHGKAIWKGNNGNNPILRGFTITIFINHLLYNCHYKPSILGYPYFWKHPHGKYIEWP